MVGWGWWCSQVAASSRAPIWCPSEWRHARGREHCRGEPGSTLLSGGYAPDSRRRRAARSLTSQGRAEPLCARITGLNREVSLISDQSFFFLRPQGAAARWLFQECTGLDGWMLARAPVHQRPPPPWTRYFDFPISVHVWPWDLDLLILVG